MFVCVRVVVICVWVRWCDFCVRALQPIACAAAGHWCPSGSSSATAALCDVGMYGTAAGATSYRNSSCAGACTAVAGQYCPAGSVSPGGVGCPVGYACATMGAPVLWYARRRTPPRAFRVCARVCLSCSDVWWPSHRCLLRRGDARSTTAGYWCPAGSTSSVTTKCAAGFYGLSVSYTSSSCAGTCTYTVGSYCPIGSYSSGASVCTRANTGVQ